MLACESELRLLPFAEIQQRATAGYLLGATYFEVNEAAVGGTSADCRYIDTHRLASDACEGTVEQVYRVPMHLCVAVGVHVPKPLLLSPTTRCAAGSTTNSVLTTCLMAGG